MQNQEQKITFTDEEKKNIIKEARSENGDFKYLIFLQKLDALAAKKRSE